MRTVVRSHHIKFSLISDINCLICIKIRVKLKLYTIRESQLFIQKYIYIYAAFLRYQIQEPVIGWHQIKLDLKFEMNRLICIKICAKIKIKNYLLI